MIPAQGPFTISQAPQGNVYSTRNQLTFNPNPKTSKINLMKTKTKKHTCGPWLLEGRGNFSGINVVTDDEIICRLPDGASVTGGACWPEQHANAHLIASAPEMLEALRGLQSEIRQAVKMDVKNHVSLMIYDAAATKAIAKAEGKE